MNTEPGALDERRKNVTTRPTAMVEVRAWLAFGVVTVVHMSTGIWWASTITQKVETLQVSMTEVKDDMKEVRTSAQNAQQAAEDKRMIMNLVADHEARLRALERTGR